MFTSEHCIERSRLYYLYAPGLHGDDGSEKKEFDVVTMLELADTYKRIAREGAATFYNGKLADEFLADL